MLPKQCPVPRLIGTPWKVLVHSHTKSEKTWISVRPGSKEGLHSRPQWGHSTWQVWRWMESSPKYVLIHVLFSLWLVENAVDTRSTFCRRLQLLTVSAVTNDESWAHYVARREANRCSMKTPGCCAGRTSCLFRNRKVDRFFVVKYSNVVFFRVCFFECLIL